MSAKPASTDGLFSSNMIRILLVIALAMVIFALVTAFLVPTIKGPEPKAKDNDSFSRKSIGTRAFVGLLKKLKVRVLRLRNTQAYHQSKLPIAFIAPNRKIRIATKTPKFVDVIKERSKKGLPSLVVLPKWKIRQEIGRRKAESIKNFSILYLVNRLLPDLQVQVVHSSDHKTPLDFQVKHPVWGNYKLASPRPQFLALPQYRYVTTRSLKLAGGSLEILFGTTEKSLLLAYSPDWNTPILKKGLFGMPKHVTAKTRQKFGKIYILTDPDLLANFNLQRGDNAPFAYALVTRILNTRLLLLDEVFHGHHHVYSIIAELRKFPHFLLVIQLLLVLGAVTWGGMRRFGVPQSADRVLERGPREIIEITAWVLTCGLKTPHMAGKYVKAILDDTMTRLELKTEKNRTAMERLDALALAHGLDIVPSQLLVEAERFYALESRSNKESLRLAHKAWYLRDQLLTHRWKK